MSVGISVTNVANPILDWLRNVAPPAVPALWMQLHVGDPGAAGTANLSVVTTRMQVTMTAAASGMITLSTVSGSWTMPTTETITAMSLFTASTAGDFLMSGSLTIPRNVASGDTLTLTTLNISHTPLAA